MKFVYKIHYKFYLILSLSLILSCDYTGSTNFKVIVINSSSHHLILMPYEDGKLKESALISLSDGDMYLEHDEVERGIKGGGGLAADYTAGTDSIIIMFDNSFRTIHLMDTVGVSTSSFYTRQSLRSLYNADSYVTEIKDLSKKERTIKYTYTFTEEDYEYAVTGGK
jgi:hypothetical protein